MIHSSTDPSLDVVHLSEQPDSSRTTPGFWRMARNNVRLLQQSFPIQTAPRELPLPLSFSQERLWQLEQLQPNTSVHNILHSFRLVGQLNRTALQQSLNEIARRHEILRTVFKSEYGQPVQVILPDAPIAIDYVDLRDRVAEQQPAEVEKRAVAQAEAPFDLSQAPLWRVALLQLAEQEYVLLRTIHHIVFDGMSHSVFVRELGALYAAFAVDKPSPLLDLPVQYVDFAWTQRQWLQGEVLTDQLNYWQQRLSGTVPPLALPTDYPRQQSTSYQGGMQSRLLSADLTRRLKALGAEQGVSLFVVLFAAFNTLLHQHTGQEDLVICSPVVGRQQAELRGLIGYFNNVVVLRTDLSENPTFCALLEQISESFLEQTSYQDTPLQLIADLPNLKRTPLTRALFALQNAPIPPLALSELSVSSVFVNREIANFDISLSLAEKDGQLTAALQYKTELFGSATIEWLLERYETLLNQIVQNPDLKLSDLPSFKPAEPPLELSSGLLANTTAAVPRNACEEKLVQIWQDVLGLTSVGIHDNFFELGGHSLLAVKLFHEIERCSGKQLPLSTLLTAPTVAQLALYLEPSDQPQSQDVIVPLKPGSGTPLFLIHDGDGETLLYQCLADQLPMPVYGIQPYRCAQHPILHTRIEEMVAYYIEKIREVQPQGPYCLGGLCAGGVLAFEVARQLQLQGQTIGLVAIFDAADVQAEKKAGYIANQRRDSFSKVFQEGKHLKPYQRGLLILNRVRQKATNLIVYEAQKRYQTLHDQAQLKFFQYGLDRKWSLPRCLQNIPVRTILVWAQEDYVPDTVLQGEVLLFRATEISSDLHGTVIDDTPYRSLYADPLLGWEQRVTSGVKAYDIPGGHSSMLQLPYVEAIATILHNHWEQVETAAAEG